MTSNIYKKLDLNQEDKNLISKILRDIEDKYGYDYKIMAGNFGTSPIDAIDIMNGDVSPCLYVLQNMLDMIKKHTKERSYFLMLRKIFIMSGGVL